MENDVYIISKTRPKHSTIIMSRKVSDGDFCQEQIYSDVCKHPDDIIRIRNDIGNNYYQASDVNKICSVFHKITNNETRLKEEDKLKKEKTEITMKRKIENDNVTQTTNKKQKFSVNVEFNYSQPVVFDKGTITLNSEYMKSQYRLFPQKRK
jgi:hypothetical protein